MVSVGNNSFQSFDFILLDKKNVSTHFVPRIALGLIYLNSFNLGSNTVKCYYLSSYFTGEEIEAEGSLVICSLSRS